MIAIWLIIVLLLSGLLAAFALFLLLPALLNALLNYLASRRLPHASWPFHASSTAAAATAAASQALARAAQQEREDSRSGSGTSTCDALPPAGPDGDGDGDGDARELYNGNTSHPAARGIRLGGGANERSAPGHATGHQPCASRGGGDAPPPRASACADPLTASLQLPLSASSPAASPKPLVIVIMVAGTRGDVQPATALGSRLASHGHRVRLATHAPYRQLVQGAGLEWWPLGGDPKGMMALTVKHRGMLFSSLKDLAWLRRQYWHIMTSCWEAATSPSPAPAPQQSGGGAEAGAEAGAAAAGTWPFKPDLVITTAITYGASHVAEALSVPLHVLSTIPWRPTSALCHPWARGWDDTMTGHLQGLARALVPAPPAVLLRTSLGRSYGKAASRLHACIGSASNWWSCVLLDHAAWLGILDLVVAFRRRLRLPLLSWGACGWSLYTAPATFTFSPGLVGRPADWGPHIEVSGPLLLPSELAGGAAPPSGAAASIPCSPRTRATSPHTSANAAYGSSRSNSSISSTSSTISGSSSTTSSSSGAYSPPQRLLDFLAAEPNRPPVYIGFGSMTVSEGREMAHAICTAVRAVGVRALISVGGWGCLDAADFQMEQFDDMGQAGDDVSQAGDDSSQQQRQCGAMAKAQLLLIEDVPHDWLFPRCSAVVHHGGVGTTAAGLLAGCPTFVAPSFGDLFFWGQVCADAGVGPPPIPIYELTASALEGVLRALQAPEACEAARRAGDVLRTHSGLDTAVAHIYRCIGWTGNGQQAVKDGGVHSGCDSDIDGIEKPTTEASPVTCTQPAAPLCPTLFRAPAPPSVAPSVQHARPAGAAPSSAIDVSNTGLTGVRGGVSSSGTDSPGLALPDAPATPPRSDGLLAAGWASEAAWVAAASLARADGGSSSLASAGSSHSSSGSSGAACKRDEGGELGGGDVGQGLHALVQHSLPLLPSSQLQRQPGPIRRAHTSTGVVRSSGAGVTNVLAPSVARRSCSAVEDQVLARQFAELLRLPAAGSRPARGVEARCCERVG